MNAPADPVPITAISASVFAYSKLETVSISGDYPLVQLDKAYPGTLGTRLVKKECMVCTEYTDI
jgi:hypothetical protein